VRDFDRVGDIFRAYANFVHVYVTEAHPTDEWVSHNNSEFGICYTQPKTTQERIDIAAAFMEDVNPTWPLVVDEIQNKLEEAYIAKPERLWGVMNGKIVYKGGWGPVNYDISHLIAWLLKYYGDRISAETRQEVEKMHDSTREAKLAYWDYCYKKMDETREKRRLAQVNDPRTEIDQKYPPFANVTKRKRVEGHAHEQGGPDSNEHSHGSLTSSSSPTSSSTSRLMLVAGLSSLLLAAFVLNKKRR